MGSNQLKKIATIFGGSGFLGRYVVQKLAKQGYEVRVAVRNPRQAEFLRTCGAVGQIIPVKADILDEKSYEPLLMEADLVINLVGILYERGKSTFDKVHHVAVENLAKLSSENNVKTFIHVSALGADETSLSKYSRSKFKGEQAVLKNFPKASILRPSIIFGVEDNFFNQFAAMAKYFPFLPLIGGGETKFQPVYVGDVADAIMATIDNKKAEGKIFELGGPKKYRFRDLLEYILKLTNRKTCLMPVPFFMASFKGLILEKLPFAPLLTRDQVKLLKTDNVVRKGAKTLKDLSISPKSIEAVVPSYLSRFKKN